MGKRWTLAIVFCVGLLCIYSFDRIYCEQEDERYTWVLDKFAERLERTLHDGIGQSQHAVEDLKVFMLLGDTIPSKEVFEQFVASSLKYYPEVTAMAYSDETYTVRYLYPKGSSIMPLGINLSDVNKYPYFNTVTLKAEREKRTTVNKTPVQISNGFAVFGLRAPLFVGERFQGMVWANFVADMVLQEAIAKVDPALADNEGNYYVEILTEGGDLLYKLNHLPPASTVRETRIPIADTYWLMKTGWSRQPQPGFYIRGLIWGLGSSVLVLLLLLLNGMFRRQAWLAQAVAERTKEILLKNKQLQLEIMEHEDTEQALLVSEQRLAAMLSAVPDKMYRLSREGKVLDVQARESKDLYLPRVELLNKDVADVLPPDLYDMFLVLSKTVLTTGEMATTEYQLPINGRRRELEARLIASANEEIVVIVRDITEKKQDEACERILTQTSAKVLEESSIEAILNYVCEQLVAVFEISLARVILKEIDDTIKVSAAAGKLAVVAGSNILNCTATGQLCGLAIQTGTLQVVQCNDKLSCWQEKLIAELQLDKTEIQSEIALPLKLKGITVGSFYLISTKLHYWDERIVTRLQRFSDQLSIAISAARDRQRLSLLIAGLEAAANAIVITGRDGNVEWINPAFAGLTGYTEEEVLGQNLMLLSGYQDEKFCERFWQQLNSAQVAWRGEFAHHRKDGSLYEEVMSITPVRNNHGEIVNFITIKEDITEHKMAAAAMAKANEARAQAEKLSSMGTMAAGLSHEINQPLNSIKMLASGMVYAYHNGKERPVGDIMRNVEEISNQSDRINNIIMHMRSFIRRDDSQVTYCNVNETIEQSLKIIGSQLTSHGVKVQKELADQLPLVYAMPTALEEIVVNLASNAMQAMDSIECQDKLLIIRTWAVKNTVYIRISDNGPGIMGTHRTKVFEPFFSTKLGSDNLGLGLSIVQSIVTSCQGTISIVSAEDEGAAFVITFPGIIEEAI